MGRHDATICMNESVTRLPDLARTGLSGHLLPGLYRMGHTARHTAVPERQQATVGVQRQHAACGKVARTGTLRRPAPGGKANFFQQHGEGDGEGVVDGEVVHVVPAQASLVKRPLRSLTSAALQYVFHGREVLLAMGRSLDAASASLRFSFGPDTTAEAIDALLSVLPGVVERARSAA